MNGRTGVTVLKKSLFDPSLFDPKKVPILCSKLKNDYIGQNEASKLAITVVQHPQNISYKFNIVKIGLMRLLKF